MTAKKKLITRMARWTAGVLAIALLVVGATRIKEYTERQQWRDLQKKRRTELFAASRSFLDELAQRIDSVPVDPTLVSEIESRYFEHYDDGPMAVWALATDGTFLFGVPRETFSRMNAIYDREITPRLEEGVFFDRQSFFLGHLEDAGEILLRLDVDSADSDDGSSEEEGVSHFLERLDLLAQRSDDSFILSAPLKTSDGTALGSIYLNRSAPEREYYRTDERLAAVLALAGGLAGLSFVFLWLLLPTWVYVDARERGVARASLFAFLTAVSSLVGLVVYLIARPEHDRSLVCPGCEHEVDGGAYCPHCGQDLSSSICQTCRYPLEADWVFCPSCRTRIHSARDEVEVEAPSGEGPVPETG